MTLRVEDLHGFVNFIPSLVLLGPLSLLLLALYFIRPRFSSPLSAIPAANFWASFTPLWILWIRFTRRVNKSVHAAHVAHGPVVRLSPSEISVNLVDGGIRTIYGVGFEKTNWYSAFRAYGVNNAFSTLEPKPHSILRRRVSNVYSKAHILSPGSGFSHIAHVVLHERLMPILHSIARGHSPIDVAELFIAIGMDLITAYEFGLSCSSNFLENEQERKRWSSLYATRRPHAFWGHEAPHVKNALEKFGIHVVPRFVEDGYREIEDRILAMVKKAEARFESGVAGEYEGDGGVYGQMRRAIGKEEAKGGSAGIRTSAEKRMEIAAEMFDDTFAGHEAPAMTLIYLAYNFSIHPALQSRLQAELSTVPPSENIDIKAIDSLPFLEACILETLRRYPPAAGSQPRTPMAGTSCYISLGVDGRTILIPPGVRVSAQAYSLHRNEDIFPNAEKWNPERWLVDKGKDARKEQERLKQMMRWFWAFGSGGRMCFGNHFALLEMKIIVATIWSRFWSELADTKDLSEVAAGMEQEDGGDIAGPVAYRLDLRFTAI